MLCTPPAFILSQDQTLEIIISYLGSPSYNLSSYSFLASLTLLSIYNSYRRDLVFRTSQCFVQSLLLFNFQWPFASLFPLGRDSLSIIPHSTPFVKSFFWFSSTFFLTSRLVRSASLKATRILYHFLPSLSSAFLKFFWKMLKKIFLRLTVIFYWQYFILML